MKSLLKGKRKRGRRRARRILKVFTVGAGLGAAAGLLSPPRRAKRSEAPFPPASDEALKQSEGPAEVIETEAASDTLAQRPAAAARPKRSVAAKVSNEKAAGPAKPKPKSKPQDPS